MFSRLIGLRQSNVSGLLRRSFTSFYQERVIGTPINHKGQQFQDNYESMSALNNEFNEHLKVILQGGGKRAQENLIARKKLTVRDRITKLLDRGSPFLELGQLAGHDLYGHEKVPAGGVVTGVGLIHNRWCMVVANDPTVAGGSYYPITVKKHIRAQEIAQENRLPCLYLVDSGGANLPRQQDVFPDRDHFGRIFYNQARMSQLGIPQIALVLGSCTAGGAYVPAMSDENVIVKKNGTIFLAGPPLVKEAIGESVDADFLGGADTHTKISGVSDHYARDEIEALQIGRSLVSKLNTPTINYDFSGIEEPLYDANDLNYLMNPDLKQTVNLDSREIIARIVDGSRFNEYKKEFGSQDSLKGPNLICGFSKLYNQDVGILSNNGVLFSQDAMKGANFIELCSQRKIPLLFLQNITGFMVGSKSERDGIAKHGAKLVNAVSTTQVPKLTLIFGGSYGAGNYGMCGRAFQPRFLYSWPSAKISVMGGEQAAGVLVNIKKASLKKQGKDMEPEVEKEMREKHMKEYNDQASIYYASARLWDDGVILPQDTRQLLGLSLLVSLNKPVDEFKGFGVFRM